jgi:hypothetical protein
MHVKYPVIVTLIFHYFYFFIPINVTIIIYLLMILFLRMFIDGVLKFYLLILNVYLYQFLMLKSMYATNIF